MMVPDNYAGNDVGFPVGLTPEEKRDAVGLMPEEKQAVVDRVTHELTEELSTRFDRANAFSGDSGTFNECNENI